MDQTELLAKLEREIGFPPGTRLHVTVTNRKPLQQWLIAKGVDQARVLAAQDHTLAAAYANEKYLSKMLAGPLGGNFRRRNISGGNELSLSGLEADSFNLAGDREAEREEAEYNTLTQFMSPETKPQTSDETITATAAQIARASEVVIGTALEKFRRETEKQILDAAANAARAEVAKQKITLTEEAKESIRKLVRDTTLTVLEEKLPPRIIEVKQTSGETVDLGLQHEMFPKLLQVLGARDAKGYALNVWLTGPTGSGKTTAVESCARALGVDFGLESSLDSDYKVVGFIDAQGRIVSPQFRKIFEHGGVFCADEIDNWYPSALVAMNAALANNLCAFPDGMVRRHKDCIIVACANTWGLGATDDYVGRSKLDAATLNRFLPKLDWPYDERLERAIANSQGGNLWCSIVQEVRRNAKTQGLQIIISPRDTYAGIALLRTGFTPAEVADMTFAAPLKPEQRKALRIAETIAKHANATANAPAGVPGVGRNPTEAGIGLKIGPIIKAAYAQMLQLAAEGNRQQVERALRNAGNFSNEEITNLSYGMIYGQIPAPSIERFAGLEAN